MPAPSFGNADNGQNVSLTNETTNGKGYGQAAYMAAHPDQWRKGANGKYEHRDPTTGLWSDPNDVKGGTFGNWFDGLTSGRTDVMGNDTEKEVARKKAEAAAAAAAAETDTITDRMNAFIKSMMGDIDQNDPVFKGLITAGVNAAGEHAGMAGLSGRSGMAGTQSASVAQANVLPWQIARKTAGAAMLGQLSNRDISLGNLAQGQQIINNGIAESQSNAAKNTWGTIGVIGGGIVGGYYGGPEGAKAGALVGGSALGSLGGGGASGPSYSGNTWRPAGGGYKPGGTGY